MASVNEAYEVLNNPGTFPFPLSFAYYAQTQH